MLYVEKILPALGFLNMHILRVFIFELLYVGGDSIFQASRR